MAVVYKAEDAVLGRPVALKTLHRHYAEHDSFRRRFQARGAGDGLPGSRERRQSLRYIPGRPTYHSSWPSAWRVGTSGPCSPSVVENLSEEFTRRVVSQLLHGLSYAHRMGIIHRDIKPSNVLLTPEGTVKSRGLRDSPHRE